MTLEQALAVLVIAALALFTLWGRTQAGQAALFRWFGSPTPQPVHPARRRARSQPRPKSAKPASRPSSRSGGNTSRRAKREQR